MKLTLPISEKHYKISLEREKTYALPWGHPQVSVVTATIPITIIIFKTMTRVIANTY